MLVWKRTVSIFNTEYELQEKHSLFLPFFNLSCRILPQNDIQRPVFIIQNELTSFQNGCIIEIDGTERGCFRSFRNQFSNFRIFYNKHTRKEDVILCVKQFVPCWVSLAERWRLRSEARLSHWFAGCRCFSPLTKNQNGRSAIQNRLERAGQKSHGAAAGTRSRSHGRCTAHGLSAEHRLHWLYLQ